jgi:redox-sensitive bicupin YhaK (pirin superfamily)
MTAGHGICHAEVSPDEAPATLHGVQLWVCLPDEVRNSTPADFTHLAELPTYTEHGATLRVLVGSLAGETSPAPTHTPIVGVELTLQPGAEATVPLDRSFEYGVLVAQGAAAVDGIEIERNAMSYLGSDRSELSFRATGEETVLMLLGGEPFEEEIVMWWNLIGRSHEEIVEQREAWNGDGLAFEPPRYGVVRDFDGNRLLAPPMPNTRLKARGRSV